jgi:hypothetical protein
MAGQDLLHLLRWQSQGSDDRCNGRLLFSLGSLRSQQIPIKIYGKSVGLLYIINSQEHCLPQLGLDGGFSLAVWFLQPRWESVWLIRSTQSMTRWLLLGR